MLKEYDGSSAVELRGKASVLEAQNADLLSRLDKRDRGDKPKNR